jgi:hypothetical protein
MKANLSFQLDVFITIPVVITNLHIVRTRNQLVYQTVMKPLRKQVYLGFNYLIILLPFLHSFVEF